MKLIADPVKKNAAEFLDYLSARQKVIAANLANIDTPGYRVKDLTFKRELFSASGGKELPGLPPDAGKAEVKMVEVQGLPSKNDGNNVRLDREMALLSETSVKYQMMVNMLMTKGKMMKSAASDGR